MSSKSVIVIGAGLAGLSSGVALAEAGFRVKLLEQRPFLGGRASSYSLPDGEQIDNCQHVTLGCCTNLDDFYERMGALAKIARYGRLVFVDSAGHRAVMAASALPPPFHLACSLGRALRGVSRGYRAARRGSVMPGGGAWFEGGGWQHLRRGDGCWAPAQSRFLHSRRAA